LLVHIRGSQNSDIYDECRHFRTTLSYELTGERFKLLIGIIHIWNFLVKLEVSRLL